MNLKTFNIYDTTFSHDKYTVAGQNSEYIQWNRNITELIPETFYSHQFMYEAPAGYYGLLYESQAIIPYVYEPISPHINKFKLIFTHSSTLLNQFNNCRWIPGGGIWVGGTVGLGKVEITKKSKLCSMVTSEKRMCPLHEYRLEIANNLNTSKVDLFRHNWIPIYESLEKYMFSIVVENYIDELYFTEKILNCFATGTIPIYLGASKIGQKFNENGILRFYDIPTLQKFLDSLNEKEYYSRMDAIQDNFQRCKQYRIIEDYIYRNYFE